MVLLRGPMKGVFHMIEVPLYVETSITRTRTRVGASLMKNPAPYFVETGVRMLNGRQILTPSGSDSHTGIDVGEIRATI